MSEDGWVLAQKKAEQGLSLIRIRKLDPSFPFQRFSEKLSIIWSFQESDSGGMPTESESALMEEFENSLCASMEGEEEGFLVVVFTEPGYREFTIYASGTESLINHLNELPQKAEPYPIEIHHESDPTGAFYESYARKLIKRP